MLEGHCLPARALSHSSAVGCTMSDAPLHRSVSPLQQLQRLARGQSMLLQPRLESLLNTLKGAIQTDTSETRQCSASML